MGLFVYMRQALGEVEVDTADASMIRRGMDGSQLRIGGRGSDYFMG